MNEWYCLSMKELFDAKVSGTDEYAYCQFGTIERDDEYYDFGTTGMPRLCCDGEQCKLIKVENDIYTFLSDGNSYEDNVEDYYFKLTKEEAEIAGVIYG